MKRIISIILAVISTVIIAVPAFADETGSEALAERITEAYTEEYADEYTGEGETEEPHSEEQTEAPDAEEVQAEYIEEPEAITEETTATETAEEPAVRLANEPAAVEMGEGENEDSSVIDDVVAIMYLCISGPHSPYLFGHAWICIENPGDETIDVCGYTLEPGEMMSMGLHSGRGMTFNEEMHDYKGKTVQAKKTELRKSDLANAESEISNSRWGWYELFSHNCTNFATSVWKRVTGQRFAAFCFPFIVQIQMAISGTSSLRIG